MDALCIDPVLAAQPPNQLRYRSDPLNNVNVGISSPAPKQPRKSGEWGPDKDHIHCEFLRLPISVEEAREMQCSYRLDQRRIIEALQSQAYEDEKRREARFRWRTEAAFVKE